MRPKEEIRRKMLVVDNAYGILTGYITLNGKRASVVCGFNEGGWEHVSVNLLSQKLPTWEEMCQIKDMFWSEDEMVVQIHPKKSEYVNLVEALHLWRPVNGNWELLNEQERRDE